MTLGEGYQAEIHSNQWHVRPIVRVEPEGWTWSLVDLGDPKYQFPMNKAASDAEEGKRQCEEYLRTALGVGAKVEWFALENIASSGSTHRT